MVESMVGTCRYNQDLGTVGLCQEPVGPHPFAAANVCQLCPRRRALGGYGARALGNATWLAGGVAAAFTWT